MEANLYYLKPNLVIEPLIDRWYAWAHLISPATAAMNILNRHIKIMNSYIQAPQLHAAAILNSKMLGGPFMDYKTARVDEIKHLKNDIVEERIALIELANAIKELDQLLKSSAGGHSLESLYSLIPESIKGYVELIYDLNNHPSFRLYESLLYKSPFYIKKMQSIALWLTDNDIRPFCLSTAKLNDPSVLNLPISFDNTSLDALSRMKREAGNIDEIADQLGISNSERPLFDQFFTLEKPAVYQNYNGKSVRMRYFGHACILIETNGISILVDPVISYYGYESTVDHFSDVDLPDIIDYVLITHNHQDHILLETLIPLRHKIKNLVVPRSNNGSLQDPNLGLMFKAIGFENVVEIDELQELQIGDCTILGVPFMGEHSDLNIQSKICYHVTVNQFTFLFMADSRILEPKVYENIHHFIGDVDVLFLGMECDGAPLSWLYGPLLTTDLAREMDQSRRLSGSDFNKGRYLIDIFNPKELYVYAMGQEPWLEFISSIKYTEESNPIIQSDNLIKLCVERGIIAERLFGEKEILYTPQ